MVVTGEYHNKILMALYTCIMFACRFLHTQDNHILLHNGNRNTDREYEAGSLNGLMFLHRPCSGTAPHNVFDLYTRGLRYSHQFSIVSIYVLTQMWI